MNHEALTSALQELDVSNVFIYVGDAVRADALPKSFRTQGSYVRTIASSTHSPASFASLVTGCYPPTHGVTSFSDRIPADLPRLFDLDSFESQFLNSIFEYATEYHGRNVDPIYSVLDMEPPTVDSPLEGLDSPFVAMERGPGGHAPYGDYTGTAEEYFEDRGGHKDTIESDYIRSIELDIELFQTRLDELAERGLLDDTLVVYTSDHGELLGEGGVLGHNDPMRPELVYVPTVFRHSELPNESFTETSFHHVDLMPTLLSVLGHGFSHTRFDGTAPPEAFSDHPRPCFWRNRFLPDWLPLASGVLSYEGVWDSSGGRVRSETSRCDRYSVLAGKLARSSKRAYMRRHLGGCLGLYWWSVRAFGAPDFDSDTAGGVLQRAKKNGRGGRQVDLSADEVKHLRNLGYLNE